MLEPTSVTTLERLMRKVNEMAFTGGVSLWHPRVGMYEHPDIPREIHLDVYLRVPDRMDGMKMIDVVFHHQYDRFVLEYATPAVIEAMVLNLVRQTLLHELDEGIIFDGARFFDPHRPTSAAAPALAGSAAGSGSPSPR